MATPEILSQAIPVAVEGMTMSSWLLVGLNVLFGGGLVAAAIKVWPQLKQIASEERAKERGFRKDELDDMRQRITDLERQVKEAKDTAHSSEMKLVFAINAVRLLAGKVAAENPDDPVLKQAMEMLSASITGDLGAWERELAVKLPEVREKYGKAKL